MYAHISPFYNLDKKIVHRTKTLPSDIASLSFSHSFSWFAVFFAFLLCSPAATTSHPPQHPSPRLPAGHYPGYDLFVTRDEKRILKKRNQEVN